MRARSWMAALALIAGTSIAVGRAMPASSPNRGDESQGRPQQPDQSKPRSPAADSKPAVAPVQSVLLNLEIAGLGSEGCDVEVKPGNASCKFRVNKSAMNGAKTVRGKEGRQHVSSEGHALLELTDVQLRGADRVCTVAITVLEPGQTSKTVYRGFRLAPRTEAGVSASASGTVPSFTCYLSSPSKVATIEQTRARK
jgi:hypothetical protein